MGPFPKFHPIETPECVDRGLVMGDMLASKLGLRDLAIVHMRVPRGLWEKLQPEGIMAVVRQRRFEKGMLKSIRDHVEKTGRPVTRRSVLRVMEFWEPDFVQLLVFRDRAHMTSAIRHAQVADVMAS